jgi:orotate phosphoribosyltransferase
LTDLDALLRSTGAILEGHFRLASGRHSGVYIEKFRIMENPAATEAMCRMIAAHFADAGASVVVGVGFLIDRTSGGVDFGLPFYACHAMQVESYSPDDCPLCRQGLPLVQT